MTKIDIILPYYNGSKYIKEQLDSILNSKLESIDLNIILINDSSLKSETEYLKSILPSRAKYIENEKNLGVIKTVEKGLSLSEAPYIMLCDHDDIWLPEKIKNTLEFMKKVEGNLPCLVYTDLAIVDFKLNTLQPSMHNFYNHNHKKVKPSIIFHNIVTGCTVMINRKLLELALPMPISITMHDHWLALVAVFAGKIEALEEVTILYRQHGRNQVGAPQSSNFEKLLHFRETLPRLFKQIVLKQKMSNELASRLNPDSDNYRLIKDINGAIKEKDVLFLIRSGVISGDFARIISICGLIILSRQLSAFFPKTQLEG